MTSLFTAWHHIDAALLKGDLLRSLTYLHSQPPLFNLFLVLVLKLSGDEYPVVFHAIYLGLGLGVCLITYLLARQIGPGKFLAFTLAALFSASPDAVLHENVLIYRLPVALLILAGTYLLHRDLTGNRWLISGSFLLFAALVGTRPAYHPALIALLFIYLLRVAQRSARKDFLLGGGISLIISISFYLKNAILFGQFVTSTWLGMNLWHVTTQALDQEGMRVDLISKGELAEISRSK